MINEFKSNKCLMLFLLLFLLPSCSFSDLLDWFKGKGSSSDDTAMSLEESTQFVEEQPGDSKVLVSVDGTPVLTIKSLQKRLEILFISSPELKNMVGNPQTGKFWDRLVTESIVHGILMDKYLKANNIDRNENYKNDIKLAIENIISTVNRKWFLKSVKVPVTEQDLKEYYEENKDRLPGLMITPGSVQAIGVMFANEQDAQAFQAKVNQNKGDLQAAAAQAKVEIRDFKDVTAQTVGLENALRQAIIAMVVPTIVVVKGADNNYWVLSAISKKEAAYKPFEQVKTMLKVQVEGTKEQKAEKEKVEELKKQYNVIIDEQYFNVGKTEQEVEEAIQKEVEVVEDAELEMILNEIVGAE